MKIIIAEKPSLARNIAAAIGNGVKKNGYIACQEYLVTWAFGHLFSLVDIEDYAPTAHGRWCMDNLPCLPEKFRFALRKGKDGGRDEGVAKQFELIKALCTRADVDTIINAGDADREGEIIIRLCIQNAGVTDKRVQRLWLPDQTPETIRTALGSMKDAGEYDLLAGEGFARTYIDWLYGVNLTRFATLKTGTFLRVGRVIIPIVKAIYDRDMAIRHFKPEPYLAIVSAQETNGEKIELVSKNKFSADEQNKALALCAAYNEAGAYVTAVKRKKDKLNPGKLYSLSKLQNFLGKKYKMPMEESLKVAQKLYEEGYLTYPRTNSEYLATAEKDKIRKIIAAVAKKGYPVCFKDQKSIFDDSKIESHSALTPTYKIPDPARMTENEKIVYSAVMRRFVAVFCSEDCIADKTEIKIQCADEEFTLKGTVILEKGWTRFDDTERKNKMLPALKKGDAVNVNFQPVTKETHPPKHYTIETLNNYLKNPFREEKARLAEEASAEAVDDAEDYKAIFEGLELGTEATRTGIIDNARHSHYIELKKDVYRILPEGEYLIESLARMGISMDKYKTSEMGKALKKVYHGEYTVEDSVAIAKEEIRRVFAPTNDSLETDTDIGLYGDEMGVCPLCGQTVVRTKFGYGCRGYKEGCRFSINLTICGRVISAANVKQLLATGKTAKIKGFISKAGKPFDGALCLQEGKVNFDFSD
ncbi:MAG: DNA topoisomerase III [Clostridiales bacterium]|nr:DNA topoisomerase III [Clostridiales bacterium]